MNRDKQEMALWAAEYSASRLITREGRAAEADAAVEAFRLRYPPQPVAPAPVWYDDPPFKKDGGIYYCWVEGSTVPQSIYWSGGSGAWVYFCNNTPMYPLHGRRVCPITRPPEPTT